MRLSLNVTTNFLCFHRFLIGVLATITIGRQRWVLIAIRSVCNRLRRFHPRDRTPFNMHSMWSRSNSKNFINSKRKITKQTKKTRCNTSLRWNDPRNVFSGFSQNEGFQLSDPTLEFHHVRLSFCRRYCHSRRHQSIVASDSRLSRLTNAFQRVLYLNNFRFVESHQFVQRRDGMRVFELDACVKHCSSSRRRFLLFFFLYAMRTAKIVGIFLAPNRRLWHF